ncbi:MAG TPA: ATP-binding protein [Chitinophagaceae bacterium]
MILITVVGTFLLIFLSITLFIFFYYYQKRKFKHIREKQQLQTNFRQELLQTQLEIQEQTFQNISQEIHDNIGQMLSLAKLNLNTAEVTGPAASLEKIERTRELVSKVIGDLRDLSKSLNPEIITRIGLGEAVQRELLMVAKSGQYNANLTQNGDFYRFNPQKELIVFRIFQEILNNIIKHSSAKTVNVSLNYQPGLFSLSVMDDGDGFDIALLESHSDKLGQGIRNMQTRAKMIGGNLKMESSAGKGTIILLELANENML